LNGSSSPSSAQSSAPASSSSRRKRVEFRINLQGPSSWEWLGSCSSEQHVIIKRLTDAKLVELGISETDSPSWGYSFDDCDASIHARLVPKGKRLSKSVGRCGYEWMVASILSRGSIKVD